MGELLTLLLILNICLILKSIMLMPLEIISHLKAMEKNIWNTDRFNFDDDVIFNSQQVTIGRSDISGWRLRTVIREGHKETHNAKPSRNVVDQAHDSAKPASQVTLTFKLCGLRGLGA